MRIALLGTRGIPARYGGFETFAEELSTRLVERGHSVTVYCREKYVPLEIAQNGARRELSSEDRHGARRALCAPDASYRGVTLKYLPTVRHKYLDTMAHTCVSTLHVVSGMKYDALLYCNAANAVFTWVPRLRWMPVALNVDGLERNRKKWNRVAKAWYRMSEWLATWMPNEVVTDAQAIQDYYRDTYGRASTMIPYGAEIGALESAEVLVTLGLERRSYFLYVSRMEPENNALLVREAFEKIETGCKLALIGDAPYAAEYIRRVRDTRDARVVMPGGIYGVGYRELGSHCLAYVHATEVGGTHPALIEAMGRGAVTLYLDTPENAEVAGGAGLAFTHANLEEVLRRVLEMPEEERELWREKARERIRARYSWDAVTDSYERLLKGMAKGRITG